MKLKLYTALKAIVLLSVSHLSYSQAPDLGAASSFAVFTATGAFTVAGEVTLVTGDVGTNVGEFTGFPPGVLMGQIHVADSVAAEAASSPGLRKPKYSNLRFGNWCNNGQRSGSVSKCILYWCCDNY